MRRTRVHGAPHFLQTALLAGALLVGSSGRARADERKSDVEDGSTACRAFDAKNERELEEWTKLQPAVPYQYPRAEKYANAPWGPFLSGIGGSGELLAATFIPHLGVQARGDLPAVMLSWPWSIPFGPAYTCSRKQGTFIVEKYKVHRLMIEPGFVSNNRGIGAFVRPGYRFMYHPSDWVLGLGLGVGSTLETGNREPNRASLSPEAVVQFGHCCESGYFTLTGRYDKFWEGQIQNIFGVSLGFVYF